MALGAWLEAQLIAVSRKSTITAKVDVRTTWAEQTCSAPSLLGRSVPEADIWMASQVLSPEHIRSQPPEAHDRGTRTWYCILRWILGQALMVLRTCLR